MREVKDSGIEWAQNIPATWSVMPNKYLMHKVKNICPIYAGEDILSLTMQGVIIRDLDTGGKMPASFNGYQLLTPGNLLMCLFDYDVTPRCIGLIKNEGVTSPAYSQFTVTQIADARYYYYYYLMLDTTKELLHLAKNLRHSFTENQLGEIKAPVPPIAEQKAIADLLDFRCSEIDSLSADIQKQIDILNQYKQSVITEAVTKGLDKNAEMKDSGVEWIGEIPKDWSVIPVKYCFRIGNGSDPITDDGNTPVYGSGSKSFKMCREFKKGPTVLLGRKGTVNIPQWIEGNYWNVDTAFDVKCKNSYPLRLLYYDACCFDYDNYSTQTALPSMTQSNYNNFRIPLCDISEQLQIVDYLNDKCSRINSVISDKQKRLDKLAEYKKSLIYEYVTGKKVI